MPYLQVFIDWSVPIGLGAVALMLVVNWVAIVQATRKANQLRAVAGGLAIEVRALQQKLKGIEAAYGDLADTVSDLLDKGAIEHLNGADIKACAVPASDDDIPF